MAHRTPQASNTPATPTKPKTPRLGERRTLLEEVPDAAPNDGTMFYRMSHQICVPGGWETLAREPISAPHGLAGVYGPVGQMLEHREARRVARILFQDAAKKVACHPYTRLDALVTTVDLQEGTEGEPRAWDDPGVAMDICHIIRSSGIL